MENTGITKEFLETVLNKRISRFYIQAGSQLGDNYSCDMYAVDIWMAGEDEDEEEDEGEAGDMRSIIVKCYPTNVVRQRILDSTNSFVTELGIYKQVLPEIYEAQKERSLELNFPEFLFGQHVPPEERAALDHPMLPIDNCIILPDLRKRGGFRLRDKFLSFDKPHFRLIVEAQAKLHAISWAYKCKSGIEKLHDKYPYLKKSMSVESRADIQAYKGQCYDMVEQIVTDSEQAISALRYLKSVDEVVQKLYYDSTGHEDKSYLGRTKDTVLREPREQLENEEPWSVLCHGDAWSNNMLFRYDNSNQPVEVAFVDLQLARENDLFSDLVYSLYLSTSRDFRTQHMSSMLKLYYSKFTELCDYFNVPYLPGWSWEEMSRRFHRTRIFGAHMAVYILPIIFKSPEESLPMSDMDKSSSSSSEDSNEPMSEFLNTLSKAQNIHPVLKERFLGVLEELFEDGVI